MQKFSSKRVTLLAASVLASAAFAPAAHAEQSCLGLDCPGVTPSTSGAHGPVPLASGPRDLASATASGFYDFGTNGPRKSRAVAFVATPGQWNAAPREIRSLPAAGYLTASDKANSTIVIYDAKTVTATPAAADSSFSSASVLSFSCTVNTFCLYDQTGGNGSHGTWGSVGVWQNLSDFGWQGRGRSMNNVRGGYTLLERSASARYCAIPNSQDGSLANNGYDQNTGRVYLSSSATRQAAWNCTN